jgi:3-hydroxymyristoyl/3-hydroxydecanoyl-(acyl carrier protein) dehydratase
VEAMTGLLQVRSAHMPVADWFITADRACITDLGFTLLGRADRIAKIAGKRISLTAVEQLIQQHPLVDELRVTILPERGDRLGAVVVLTADGCQFLQDHGKKALNELLKQGLEQALERIAIPRYWRYPTALPQNSQGKVTQAELQALFIDKTAPTLPLVITRAQQGTALQLTLDIPANLLYFDGHFPGNPVLAGIIQTHWAVHYAREYWGDPGEFAGLEAVKFQQLIIARQRVLLELDYAADKGKVYFSYRTELNQTNARTFSSGRILFRKRIISNET